MTTNPDLLRRADPQSQELVSVREAAEMLGVAPNTVYAWVRSESIQTHQNTAGHTRVRVSEVLAHQQERSPRDYDQLMALRAALLTPVVEAEIEDMEPATVETEPHQDVDDRDLVPANYYRTLELKYATELARGSEVADKLERADRHNEELRRITDAFRRQVERDQVRVSAEREQERRLRERERAQLERERQRLHEELQRLQQQNELLAQRNVRLEQRVERAQRETIEAIKPKPRKGFLGFFFPRDATNDNYLPLIEEDEDDLRQTG